MMRDVLLRLLDGSDWATCRRDDGRPGRIALPADPAQRARLVQSHIDGSPATLEFHARDVAAWTEHVGRVELSAYMPAADGRCGWLGIDLDAADGHGPGGLADPPAALRALAERADAAGLLGGLVATRSRGGAGRHAWLILPEPVALKDAVLGVAAIAAAAFRVAFDDESEHGEHAFRRADGELVRLGSAGAVELFPRSTARPDFGWALSLPTPDRLLDPFTDELVKLETVPTCDAANWARFVAEARADLARRRRVQAAFRPAIQRKPARWWFDSARKRHGQQSPIERASAATRRFLAGQVSEGTRNAAAFAAACNLLGHGVSEAEAERLVLEGAERCGLSEREARACFSSAVGILRRKGKL